MIVPRQTLETRAARLRARVESKLAEIAQVKADRDAALLVCDEQISCAQARCVALHGEQESEHARLDEVRLEAEALIRRGQAMLGQVERERHEVDLLDTGERQIDAALVARTETAERWAAELRRVQDGHTRRAITQLEKTERRLAEGLARPKLPPVPREAIVGVGSAGLPLPSEGYGTPAPQLEVEEQRS